MTFVSSDILRTQFSEAMSHMYQQEVPLYGALLELVVQVNEKALLDRPDVKESLQQTGQLERISQERHGAIRLGNAQELFTMRRLFAILGMYPVSYYDLAAASIPVHSTAFRPIDTKALSINPFRIFTSLLRTDLITDAVLRQKAEAVLAKRQIFSVQLLTMLDEAEKNNYRITESDTSEFIESAVDIFRWHSEALVEAELYNELHDSHRLIADVVSFKGPHINHLTPSALNIDAAQALMPEQGMTPKAVVEGPPYRQCPILLRQTSFKALQEPVKFPEGDHYIDGSHTARFGEIEQRGIALTPKGQALYDDLLNQTREKITPAPDGSNANVYVKNLEDIFSAFPDNYETMRAEELAFFYYSPVNNNDVNQQDYCEKTIEQLLGLGLVRFDPILYEDFLPISAAGIFQSNLGDDMGRQVSQTSHQDVFEKQLGSKVINRFDLYKKQQQQSIENCLAFFKNE